MQQQQPGYEMSYQQGMPPPQAAGNGQGPGLTFPGPPAAPREAWLDYYFGPDLHMVQMDQKLSIIEAVTSCERKNKYRVSRNVSGDDVFPSIFAMEESECCIRNVCGNMRPFEMFFVIPQPNGVEPDVNQPFIRLERPFRLGCVCCLLQQLFIYDYRNPQQPKRIGSVREVFSCCNRVLEIYKGDSDETEQHIFTIDGTCCQLGSCGPCFNFLFDIKRPGDETKEGYISKVWAGCFKEICLEGMGTRFECWFPKSADPEEKAILMGATMLIDYMFYERQSNN